MKALLMVRAMKPFTVVVAVVLSSLSIASAAVPTKHILEPVVACHDQSQLGTLNEPTEVQNKAKWQKDVVAALETHACVMLKKGETVELESKAGSYLQVKQPSSQGSWWVAAALVK